MSQYKYRDYRPGPHSARVFMEEIYDKTNKQNAAFEKMMRERFAEEQRNRVLATASGGNGNGKGGRGSSASFWLAAGLLLGGYFVLQLL
jgi:hypothetical protein